ncbi:MAG: fatty acyl-AMP ligase [Burkholderiales bacterium]|nr:fatty acyl-AMP ligase [Burkholderiales bacterium]MDR4517403.1 fatty acyl-AMP ligase [Nitrosomonas sp.]
MRVIKSIAETGHNRLPAQYPQYGQTDMDTHFHSLVDILMEHANTQGYETAYVHWSPNQEIQQHISFQQLHHGAQAIASALQQQLPAGSRVVLAFPTGIDFITAFMGCLYAGMIAVPVYPPFAQKEWPRFANIAQDCGAALICTRSERMEAMNDGCRQYRLLQHIPCLAVDMLYSNAAHVWNKPAIKQNDIAFLQYTSGTTGDPKGVMVTHGNIMANQAMITEIFRHTTDSIVAGWLPMYHDMGLIGTVLNPLYVGFKSVLMEPIVFLRQPSRWLKAISDYRVTTSGAPNFAYDYCVDRINDREKSALDLSSWTVAFSGAEKVQMRTIENFSRAFSACGFRRESFLPCYGLAEATLFVTGKPAGQPVTSIKIDKNKLAVNAINEPQQDEDAIQITSCGVGAHSQVIIVDPDSKQPCPPSRVGEIWLAGPHVTKGYFNKRGITGQIFNARITHGNGDAYLRTGDLGFIRNGELYVTGRIKEMIIIRGKNYYPQDIEQIAQINNAVLRTGAGAAFGIELANEEKVVLVQEINKKFLRDFDSGLVYADIRENLMSGLKLDIHEIVLVRQGTIPVTTSGKISRRTVRECYLADRLDAVVDRELSCNALALC